MSKLKRFLVPIALVAFSLMSNDRPVQASNPAPVTVTNTPLPVTVTNTVPVTTQGTTTVSGTVSLSGTPSVNVASDASGLTHMHVAASRHVTLQGSSGSGTPDIQFGEIGPDGSFTAFSIPAGYVLVITDVFWEIPFAAQGDDVGIQLEIWNTSGGGTRITNTFMTTAIAGPSGGIGNAHLTSGLVIKNALPAGGRIGGSVTNTRFTLLGYLVVDE